MGEQQAAAGMYPAAAFSFHSIVTSVPSPLPSHQSIVASFAIPLRPEHRPTNEFPAAIPLSGGWEPFVSCTLFRTVASYRFTPKQNTPSTRHSVPRRLLALSKAMQQNAGDRQENSNTVKYVRTCEHPLRPRYPLPACVPRLASTNSGRRPHEK